MERYSTSRTAASLLLTLGLVAGGSVFRIADSNSHERDSNPATHSDEPSSKPAPKDRDIGDSNPTPINPEKSNSTAPTKDPNPIPVTALGRLLAGGHCEVTVAIWREGDMIPAESYVTANGEPTAACPDPEVVVAVDDTPGITNQAFPDGTGVVRYAYSGSLNSQPFDLRKFSPEQ